MNRLLLLLFCLIFFLLAFVPSLDTDFGWHYRCGHELITRGKPCLENTFSYYLSDYKAFNPSFLYDVFLAATYDSFGFNGVSILGAAIITLCGFLFMKIASGDLFVKGVAFIIIYLSSSVVFDLGLRSQFVTYLLFLLLLWLMQKVNEGKEKYLIPVPFLFLVWVNSHVGFFIGIPVLGSYILNSIIKKGAFKIQTVRLVAVGVISIVATFINPFGHLAYLEVLRHATSPLASLIAEWVPPDMATKLIIIVLYFVTVGIASHRRKVSIPFLLLLTLFTLLSLGARRNIPFFATMSALTVLYALPSKNMRFPHEITVPLLLAAAVGVAVIRIPQTLTSHTWQKYCSNRVTNYPCLLLSKYPNLEGNIFANYEWGGFLVWQRTENKVFIDGRMSAWRGEDGTNPYSVYLSIIQTQPGWDTILKKTGTDYLLISPNTFLDILLKEQGNTYGWKQIYSDSSTVLYQKTSR